MCLQNLLFNNFVCEEYGSSNSSLNGTTAEQTEYEAFVGAVAPTTSIYLEYTPITYVNLPVNLNPFTQFLVRWVTCTLVMSCTELLLRRQHSMAISAALACPWKVYATC